MNVCLCLLTLKTSRKINQNLSQERSKTDPRGRERAEWRGQGWGQRVEDFCQGPNRPHTVTVACVTAMENREPDWTQELQFPHPFSRTMYMFYNSIQQN